MFNAVQNVQRRPRRKVALDSRNSAGAYGRARAPQAEQWNRRALRSRANRYPWSCPKEKPETMRSGFFFITI
jgi:hypothetical protein